MTTSLSESPVELARWATRLVCRGEVPEAQLNNIPSEFTPAELEKWTIETVTPAGKLRHLAPTLQLSETQPYWERPTVPLGYHQPVWPARP